jgi:hypothetical protein
VSVINPVVCGSIFLALTRTLESRQKRRAAVNVALSIGGRGQNSDDYNKRCPQPIPSRTHQAFVVFSLPAVVVSLPAVASVVVAAVADAEAGRRTWIFAPL